VQILAQGISPLGESPSFLSPPEKVCLKARQPKPSLLHTHTDWPRVLAHKFPPNFVYSLYMAQEWVSHTVSQQRAALLLERFPVAGESFWREAGRVLKQRIFFCICEICDTFVKYFDSGKAFWGHNSPFRTHESLL